MFGGLLGWESGRFGGVRWGWGKEEEEEAMEEAGFSGVLKRG